MSFVAVSMTGGSLRARAGALLLALALGAGCGGDPEEERLAELGRELAELQEGMAETRARVEEREATVKAAQDELAQARSALRESERRIAKIQQEIGSHASDDVLFRLVQKRLLEDDALESVAISARVERGVVTLSGVVPKAKLRERALKIAREVPGVVSVQDRIEVPAVAAGS